MSFEQDELLKVGDVVTLKIGSGFGTRQVEITYVGLKSVQVRDELGRIHTLRKWSVLNQLYGRPKKKLTEKERRIRQQEFEDRIIVTPMGGQPGSRRNRSNY